MMRNRTVGLILISLALLLLLALAVGAFTPLGHGLFASTDSALITPTVPPLQLSPTPTPTPTPTPQPVLTVQGPAPQLSASAVYLVDMDTGNILDDVNGEKPLPMASTTKIMTALIAIESADLNQLIPIKQDAWNRVNLDGGSSDYLRVGDKIPLKDLLYGMLVQSGDDAAVAIADALGGTQQGFVQRMNLFAYHLHLFQTHYSNPDGLTLTDNQNHYSSARDLVRLATYAMSIPLFAQIVQTQTYHIDATADHQAYTWNTTNHLLFMYPGMIGVKTGHTDAAGWCLVFAAVRNNHHLMGAVLNDPNEDQRNKDVSTLLDWGFSLPLLPPSS